MAIVKRLVKGTELTHAELDNNFTELETGLAGKVDKDGTKVLSDVNFSTAKDAKLTGIEASANNYIHPSTDGSLHVPATSTTNNGKVLTAGSTAGSATWQVLPTAPVTSVAGRVGAIVLAKADVGLGSVDNTSDAAKPVSTAQQTALNTKVDKDGTKVLSDVNFSTAHNTKLNGIESGATADQTAAEIKTAYESNANTNSYTDTEKSKLAGLESSKFRGTYTSSTALPTTGNVAGSYADVDSGTVNSTTSRYIWDVNDGRWEKQIGSSTQMTASEVKTSYESNADTNAYTDAEKTKLTGIQTGAQVNAVDSVAGKTGAVTLVKVDVGLGNVDNTADTAKPVSTAQQTALNGKVNNSQVLTNVPVGALFTDTIYTHPATHPPSIIVQDATNRFVTDTEKSTWNAKASTAVVTTTTNGLMIAVDKVKLDGIEAGAQVNAVTTVAGRTGAVVLTKTDVGLANVDNTTDAAKPVSTAQQTALNGKANTAHTHTKSEITDFAHSHVIADLPVATSGTSSTTQLVRADDLRLSDARNPNGHNHSAVDITAGTLAIARIPTGTTSTTVSLGNHTHTKADVGLSSVDNTSDADKPVSTAQATSIATKLDKVGNVQAFWSGTQASYDAIGTKSPTTIYFIE